MTDHVHDRYEYADEIESIVDMKDVVDGCGVELLTADVLVLLNEHAKLEAELAKWRTKYSKNMCAECTLYGLECECDDTLNGGG